MSSSHTPANQDTRQYQLDKTFQALSKLESAVADAEQRAQRMEQAGPAVDTDRFQAFNTRPAGVPERHEGSTPAEG